MDDIAGRQFTITERDASSFKQKLVKKNSATECVY